MRRPVILIVVAVVAAILVAEATYTVAEWDQVVVTQFGRPVGEPLTKAGLHFKLPFVQKVQRYDRRLMRWDGERHQTITRDRKTILIDVTARWRISDAKQFLRSVQTVDRAHRRLDGIMESAVKNELARFDLFEVVRSTNRIKEADVAFAPEEVLEEAAPEEREKMRFLGKQIPSLPQTEEGTYTAGRPVISGRILANARQVLADEGTQFGIEIDDVLIKTFNYTSEVEQQVFLQMNEELKKIAARFRSQGARRAEEKRGEMQRELDTIRSAAQRDAERIRGEGDARATEIYAGAYRQDPGFYAFLRTLEAQEKALGDNHTLVISTDSPFYELLEDTDLLTGRR